MISERSKIKLPSETSLPRGTLLLTSSSAREMKEGLDSKSGISKFKHAREYRRASRDAYRYAKVTFARDFSYRISYYFYHSLHRTEPGTKLSFTASQVYHWAPPLRSRIHEINSAYGLEDMHSGVVETAQSLYRCRLSCKDAFPSPDLKKEWARDAWNEACAKEAYPDLLRQDEEAGLFF